MFMKKKYVRPAVTCYQIEVQRQMMAGSVTEGTKAGYDSEEDNPFSPSTPAKEFGFFDENEDIGD